MPEELGDLDVKIKDIIKEGYFSSFAKGLLPEPVQRVMDTPYRAGPEDYNYMSRSQDAVDQAKQLASKHGINPATPQLRNKLPNKLNYISYLSQYDLADHINDLDDATKQELIKALPPPKP